MNDYREHNVQFPSIIVHVASVCIIMCSVVVKDHWLMVMITHNSYKVNM